MKLTRILVMTLLSVALVSSACKEEKKPAQEPNKPDATKEAEKPADADKKPADADKKPADGDKKADADKGGSVEAAEGGGKWVKSAPYKVKFRVPEDWVIKIEDDGLSATDSDETTTVVLVGSDSHGMIQSAVADVQKKVKIKDAKFEKSDQVVLNGFPGQNVRGTAVLEKADGLDQEIQFIAYNVRVGKGAVTMMIFSEAEMYEAKKEIIEGLAKTLTKS